MKLKVLIIGPQNRDLSKLIDTIKIKNDDVIVCKKFTNDISYKDTENINDFYYLDNQTLNMSIKNNALLYAVTSEQYTTGITIDNFYNADIIYMSIADFNNISTNFLSHYVDSLLLVWLDTKHHINNELLNKDINEVKYLLDKINEYGFKYIYLLDENSEYISDIINDYIYGDETTKKQILEENS